MSIFVITGADPIHRSAHGIPREVIAQLAGRAASAGKVIAIRNCHGSADVLQCLERAERDNAEFILIDPGTPERIDANLLHALDNLPIPYIEVHADCVCASRDSPDIGHPLHVVQGYRAQSYVLALSIALEHLGHAECENNVHVGT